MRRIDAQREPFTADDVVDDFEIQLGLLGFRGFGVIHFISVFRLMSLLEREITSRGDDLHRLESIRVRFRNPDSHLLAGGNILDSEAIVKSEMARFLRGGNRSKPKQE